MKYVLLTGTSTGIGRAALSMLVEQGYYVFGTIRNERDKKRLQDEVQSELFHPIVMDVAKPKDVEKTFKIVQKSLKAQPLYPSINNAGVLTGGPFTMHPIDDYRYVFEVNFFGTLNLTKTMLPLMTCSESDSDHWSRVINVSSVFGHYGFPYIGPYVASKFALEGFSESVVYELKKIQVHMVTLVPGSIKTPIFEKGKQQNDDHLRDTPYEMSVSATKKFMSFIENNGIQPERVGHKLLKILRASKPKHRYYIIGRKLIEWILPNYTPRRILSMFFKIVLKS